jgi:RHS repeat-associated protein
MADRFNRSDAPAPMWVPAFFFLLATLSNADANEGWLPLVEDNSGTFTMQVPMEVPDGVAGLSPDLSLVYSSAGGNGNAGMGWELGYSSIRLDQRWGVPWYWRNGGDLCDLDAMNGRVFLDDAELVPSYADPLLSINDDGSFGATKSPLCTFRTRPDSFVLIRPVLSKATSCDGGFTHPDDPHGFVVFKPDGTSWWYGDEDPCDGTYRIRSTPHSAEQSLDFDEDQAPITTRWLLHSVLDRDGNTVRFHPDRREPTVGQQADPEDRGGCDGCLRAVTWTRKNRSAPKAWEGPDKQPSPFDAYSGGGPTGQFADALQDPLGHWPEQHPSHYFFALVDWELRPDRRISFASGAGRVSDRRIRQVAIGGNYDRIDDDEGGVAVSLGSPHFFRTYRLDYDAGTTARSRLRRVWEFPGAYDETAKYSAFAVPFSGEDEWNPTMHSGMELPNPWEFVYSDSATLASEGISEEFALGGFVEEMDMEGPSSSGLDPTPWLGASYQEGGFNTIELADVNGDSLPDLVQHDPDLPGWEIHEDSLLATFWPFSDAVPNTPDSGEADLDVASQNLWVRYNRGDSFSEPTAHAADPLAQLPVHDFLPDPTFTQSERQPGTGFEGASDWVNELADDVADDSPAGAILDFLATNLDYTEAVYGEVQDCIVEELDTFGIDPTTPLSEVDSELVASCLSEEVLNEAEGTDWGTAGVDGQDLLSDPYSVDTDDLGCEWWTAGGPSHMWFMGLPYWPVAPGGPQAALASWCEYRSCAPFCELGTSVTLGPARTIGYGIYEQSGEVAAAFTEDVIKGTELDDPAMVLWGRYATTRASTGNAISTFAGDHPFDVPLMGLEPKTKVRWVDGYGRSSFQTRIRSSHLEVERDAVGWFGSTDNGSIQITEGLDIDNEWPVQEGLVHSTRDWNGDGCPDRQVGGAGILHSEVSPGYDAVFNTQWGGLKESVISNGHIPTHVSYCDPQTGEFGPWQTFVLPLDHPWFMGSDRKTEWQGDCVHDSPSNPCPYPGQPLPGGNDPRLFTEPYTFNFLKVEESNSESSHAMVSAGVGSNVGVGGPSAGANLSVGPLSMRASASASGGVSTGPGLGIAGGSLSANGFGIGGFNVDFNGKVTNSAWMWVVYIITRALETFDIPYDIGVAPSTNGVVVSGGPWGSDEVFAQTRVRWTTATHDDINGDGLVDYILTDNPAWDDADTDEVPLEDQLDWVVCINDGQGSCDVMHWPGVHTRYLEASISDIYRAVEDGPNVELGMRRGHRMAGLSDHNGDGLVDFVYAGHRSGTSSCLAPAEEAYVPDEGSTWTWAESVSQLGDGRLFQTLCVQLNTGAGFAPPFDAFAGAPPSFDGMQSQFVALSCSRSRIEQSANYRDDFGRQLCGLEDFNGDGLVDYWTFPPSNSAHTENGNLHVFLNDGFFFDTSPGIGAGDRYGAFQLSLMAMDGDQRVPGDPRFNAANVAGPQAQYFTEPQMILNVGTSWERPGGTVIQHAIGDLNGDGTLDWAQSYANWAKSVTNVVRLYPLQTEVPDLLTQVWEPGGATRTLEYAPSREFMDLPTVDRQVLASNGQDLTGSGYDVHPAPSQVLLAETLFDGLGPKGSPPQRVEYAYGRPVYRHGGEPGWPSYWRRSFGWGYIYAHSAPIGDMADFDSVGVLTRFGPQADGWQDAGGDTTLSTAGLPAERWTLDGQGRTWDHTQFQWSGTRFGSLYPSLDGHQANWHFELQQEWSRTFEPVGSPGDFVRGSTWSRKSLLNGLVDCSAVDLDGDYIPDRADGVTFDVPLARDGVWDAVATARTYELSSFDGEDPDSWCGRSTDWSDVRRFSANDHYPSGRVSRTKQHDAEGYQPAPLTTEYAYGDQGQLVAEKSPTGAITTTHWDALTRTMPVTIVGPPNDEVSPQVAFYTTVEYCGADLPCPDAAWGKPTVTLDPNGLEAVTAYDTRGRVAATTDQIADAGPGGTYWGYTNPVRRVTVDSVPFDTGGLPAFAASSRGISGIGESRDDVVSMVWIDGRGRDVLSAKEAIVDHASGYAVSGFSHRDARGRVVASTWPCFSSGSWSAATWDQLDPSAPDLGVCDQAVREHTYEYDLADRVIGEALPDGGVWSRDFSVNVANNGFDTFEVFDGPEMQAPTEQLVQAAPGFKRTIRYGALVYEHGGGDGVWPEPEPSGGVTELETIEAFDVLGQRTAIARSPWVGPATEFTYDGLGRVVRYDDPDQGLWTFDFSPQGLMDHRVEWSRDGQDPVRETHWWHDSRGRVLASESSSWEFGPLQLMEGWNWTYDQGSSLLGPSGPADVSGLGPVGRASGAEHWTLSECGPDPQRVDLIYDWRHDPRGRTVETTERLLRCEQGSSSMPEKLQWQAQYREDGQERWTRRAADEEEVVTWYDAVGQAEMKGPAVAMGPSTFATLTGTYLAGAAYDLFGRPLRMKLGNGVVQSFEYEAGLDTSGALTRTTVKSPSMGALLNRKYEWDEAGNLSSWLESLQGAPLERFWCAYDGVGALQGCENELAVDKEQYLYRYDAAGNMLWESASRDGGYQRKAWQYAPNGPMYGGAAPLNAPVARVEEGSDGWRAMSLGYDGRGQLTSWVHHDPSEAFVSGGAVTEEGLVTSAGPMFVDSDRRVSWGADGRLRSVEVSDGGPYEAVSEFGYGPDGIRAWESVLAEGEMSPTVVRRFGGVDLTEDEDGELTLTSHTTVNGSRIAQKTQAVGAVPLLGVPTETRFFAGDHLGSSTVVTDEVGDLVSSVRYEPYGRVRWTGGSEGLLEDYEFGAVDRLFNGKLRQREAFGRAGGAVEIEGYDYGARIYFPELARWGSADSVTPDVVWESNPYQYVRNNPLRYVDPTGGAAEDTFDRMYIRRASPELYKTVMEQIPQAFAGAMAGVLAGAAVIIGGPVALRTMGSLAPALDAGGAIAAGELAAVEAGAAGAVAVTGARVLANPRSARVVDAVADLAGSVASGPGSARTAAALPDSLPSRGYDRPSIETKSGRAVRARDATDDWDEFLGADQTGIDPRDGLPDPDRIWSEDGTRSIRYGEHEMRSRPRRSHYHRERWDNDLVENELQRVQP